MLPGIRLGLPEWVASEVGDPDRRYEPGEQRMDLALRLAERNVDEGTGGPFGACVFESDSGKLWAPGVNLVVSSRCSVAHAEAVAIMIAQQRSGLHDLGTEGLPAMELITSAEPCVQCFGVLWWSGIRRLVTGATRGDVEGLLGFCEGPIPQDWIAVLSSRPPLPPVEVETGCLRQEACRILRRYHESGGTIYNPGSATPR
jgi:tRNA(Arg) A34 adenosine deaminase TadA